MTVTHKFNYKIYQLISRIMKTHSSQNELLVMDLTTGQISIILESDTLS